MSLVSINTCWVYAAPAAAAATADQPVPNILDLFGMSDSSSGGGATASPAAANTSSGGGADLLQLSGNPFANIVNQAGSNGGGSSVPAAALDNGMNCTLHTFLYLLEINETQWFKCIASKVIIMTFFAGPGSGFFGDILQPQGSGGNNLFSNNMPQPMVATGGANGTANADQVRPLIQF